MAKAEYVVRVETETYEEVVQRTREVKRKEVTLTLTDEEARALHSILSRVGGSPEGARGDADAIRHALTCAGYRTPNWPIRSDRYRIEGNLIFADNDGVMPRERAERTGRKEGCFS